MRVKETKERQDETVKVEEKILFLVVQLRRLTVCILLFYMYYSRRGGFSNRNDGECLTRESTRFTISPGRKPFPCSRHFWENSRLPLNGSG